MRSFILKIKKILSSEAKKLPIFFLLFLLISTLDLIGLSILPLYISLLLGEAHRNLSFISLDHLNREDLLLYFGFGLVLLFLFKALFNTFANYKILKFSQDILVDIRLSLLTKYQNLEFQKFASQNRSDFINKIHKISEQFAIFIILGLIKIVGETVIVSAILIFLFIYNPIILLIMSFVLTAIVTIYYFFFAGKVVSFGKALNEASEEILKITNEAIDGFKEIKILKKQRFLKSQFEIVTKKFALASLSYQIISIIPRYMFETVVITLFIVTSIASFYIFDDFIQTLSILSVFGFAGIRLIPSINIITQSLINLRFHKNTLDLIYFEYSDMNNHRETSINENDEGTFKSFKIFEIIKASFKFEGSKKNLLYNINLNIKKNNFVGIIGPSGSGKTSLLNLIMGFYKTTEGEINYNGINIDNFTNEWQSKIAYIPQDVFLLDQSIRTNIVLTNKEEEIDNNRFIQVLKKCRIYDVYNDFELSRSSQSIGDRGSRLSGGQKQRVAIARALYHDKEFLIMDEPTSALDLETENEIVNYIDSLKKDITILLVTHNENILYHCDSVYKIENETLERLK